MRNTAMALGEKFVEPTKVKVENFKCPINHTTYQEGHEDEVLGTGAQKRYTPDSGSCWQDSVGA